MKLYQSLEQIFKYRLMNNDQIPTYIKKMSQIGKFDQVKMNAVIVEILVRLAKQEDEEEVFTDLKYQPLAPTQIIPDENLVDTFSQPSTEKLSWPEVRAKARELGVFDAKLKRPELESLIAEKMV